MWQEIAFTKFWITIVFGYIFVKFKVHSCKLKKNNASYNSNKILSGIQLLCTVSSTKLYTILLHCIVLAFVLDLYVNGTCDRRRNGSAYQLILSPLVFVLPPFCFNVNTAEISLKISCCAILSWFVCFFFFETGYFGG